MNDRPSSQNIQVSLQELRTESDSWGTIADHFNRTKSRMDAMTLNGIQMGIFFPVHGAYENARSKVATLMEQAKEQADQISTTLSGVADQYEREEEVNAQSGRSIHEEYEQW